MTDLSFHLGFLREFFSRQKLAVLATTEAGRPYLSLMAFAATEDLLSLIIATARVTRKYQNLRAAPQVALLIDNRADEESDFKKSVAVTAQGRAEEVKGADRELLLGIFLAKHPQLKEFAASPSAALIKVKVERFYLVKKFQEVLELHMSP